MRKYRLFFFFLLAVHVILCCNNQEDKKPVPPKDTIVKKKPVDTAAAVETDVYDDCNERLFAETSRAADTSSLKVRLKSGHRFLWNQFVKDELMSTQVLWGLKDVDDDSIPELIVYNYTGGAHCCNELYVFRKSGDEYIQHGKLFAGFECMDPVSNIITFSFNEALGYFFACYACGYTDKSGAFKTIREIELRFYNGTFVVVPYSAEREKELYQNLELLSRHKYEQMEEGLMDSGWRKEFAMNFAVWHYNHGKNWQATRALFDKYYTFKDAARVWKEFRYSLKEMEKENDL